MNKYLICIVGPTGIGKTALSISLAQHFQTEIISADSRQFYKEMNLGTAVPSLSELNAAPHHFIQHKSITEAYSVGDFERDALEKLNQLFQHHNPLIMVGGSGLYVDAVTQGLDFFPKVAPKIRETLNQKLATEGIVALQNKLKTLDPPYFSEMDTENPHRIIRALEICLGTGKAYSSFRNQPKIPRDFKVIYLGLTAERQEMYQRINRRVDVMMEASLLEEARKLFPKKDLNALNTVGYKELFAYFEGKLGLEEAVSEIKKNTRRFAKRQLTWFRKNKNIHWFNYQTPYSDIIAFLEHRL